MHLSAGKFRDHPAITGRFTHNSVITGRLSHNSVITGRLTEDRLEDGDMVAAPRGFKSKLEDALTAKQEAEARVTSLEERLQASEEKNTTLQEKVEA